MYTKELLRIKDKNGYTLLRLYMFNRRVSLMLNDLKTGDAVAFDLTDEQIIELGKALMKAWERTV